MNEVNDELTTPCPMCALKHLHAAYSFTASLRPCTGIRMYSCPDYIREASTALVLLYEVPVGYKSHLQYAVGHLVRAEELAAAAECTSAMNVLREVRASLLCDGQKAVADALRTLRTIVLDNEFYGHVDEAWRELPWLWNSGIPKPLSPEELFNSFPSLVELIRNEFFDDTTPSQKGDHENGHEEERPQGGLPGCLQGRQGEEVLQEVAGTSVTPGPCPYHHEPGASCATVSGTDFGYGCFTGPSHLNRLGNGPLARSGVYAKQ